MPPRVILFTLLAFILAHSHARSIILETAGGKRVSGHVVREDKTKLVVRHKAGGAEREEEFSLQNIRVIHRVSAERLTKLRRENPRDYRDYAEELVPKAEDPEARETALRLFLIAAHLEPEKLGRSCLMSMSTIARTPEEARRCRALAYLLDPKRDPAALQPPKQPGAADKGPGDARASFLSALRELRRGRLAEARSHATREGVAELFAATAGLMDHATFLALCKVEACPACKGRLTVVCPACKGKGQVRDAFATNLCVDCLGKKVQKCSACGGVKKGPNLTDDQLRGVLKAEYVWGEEKGDPRAMAQGGARWSTLLATQRPAPVPVLSLETVTEFDPRKCVYRDGKWVEPEGGPKR